MPLKSYPDAPSPESSSDPAPAPIPVDDTAAPVPVISQEKLIARVERTRFDPANPPPIEPWAFKLSGVEIAHSGNLVTVAAAVKSGKSSVIAAMLASLIGTEGRDYLAFQGTNPGAKAVLHFDTEQSRGDHYAMMMRSLRRAGVDLPPAWFASYSMILLDPSERRAAISAMARNATAAGGLHSVFIDGVADLVFDVNDPAEACGLVSELHQLATETSCVIVTALHHNPGGEKTRGHLGSQIERKSESVLVLRKSDDVISISCKPARRVEIAGDRAPNIVWDSAAGMHLLAQSKAASADDRKRAELTELAEEVFGSNPTLRWMELQNAIKESRGWAKSTSEGRIREMKRLGVIRFAGDGLYAIVRPSTPNPETTPI